MIIGISAPKGTGKTTVADYLATLDYRRTSFAGPIIRAMVGIYGHRFEHAHRMQKDTPQLWLNNKTPRDMLKLWGMFGRSIDEDYWLRLTAEHIETGRMMCGKPDAAYVIDDVRFENEAKWVRKHGVIWHLRREGIEYAGDETEQGIKRLECDRLISLDGDWKQSIWDEIWRMVNAKATDA